MIDCHKVASQLYDYLDKETCEATTAEIEEHLKLCRACFSHVEFERLLRDHLQRKTFHVCPEKVKKRIQSLIDRF